MAAVAGGYDVGDGSDDNDDCSYHVEDRFCNICAPVLWLFVLGCSVCRGSAFRYLRGGDGTGPSPQAARLPRSHASVAGLADVLPCRCRVAANIVGPWA
eukprot:4184335-Lingulodinium_polyedra.AAC.1